MDTFLLYFSFRSIWFSILQSTEKKTCWRSIRSISSINKFNTESIKIIETLADEQHFSSTGRIKKLYFLRDFDPEKPNLWQLNSLKMKKKEHEHINILTSYPRQFSTIIHYLQFFFVIFLCSVFFSKWIFIFNCLMFV